jgi:hypothetical protein
MRMSRIIEFNDARNAVASSAAMLIEIEALSSFVEMLLRLYAL